MTAPHARAALPAPLGLLAELTHRCPLACPYCSNPLALEDRADELDTATWARVFREAAALGVLQVHLSGGEPASRRDLVEIVAAAHAAGLYTNLITSAIGLDPARLARLQAVGLDHVQLSLQDVDAASADRIADYAGAHARKLAFARSVVELRARAHRQCGDPPRQYRPRRGVRGTGRFARRRAGGDRACPVLRLGVAQPAVTDADARAGPPGDAGGRADPPALCRPPGDRPRRAGLLRAATEGVHGRLGAPLVERDAVRPRAAVPRCGNHSRPGILVGARAIRLQAIWRKSPAFQAFRGTDWMAEPCRSCALREVDFGGCRCQALAIVGDAGATDPACELSPHHPRMLALAEQDSADGDIQLPLSRAPGARRGYCHSSSLNATVALRGL